MPTHDELERIKNATPSCLSTISGGWMKILRLLTLLLPRLFFNLLLFWYSVFSMYSMFLVRKGSRDICSQQLIELACTWSIGFQLLAAIQHRIFKPVPLSRFISWLWCTPVMYTMICLVVVCSCYHGLAISSLYSILWTCHLPAILTFGAYFLCTCARLYKCTHDITAHMSSLIRIQW